MIIIFTLNTLNHLFVVESPLIALLADSNFMGILDDNFLGDIFAEDREVLRRVFPGDPSLELAYPFLR